MKRFNKLAKAMLCLTFSLVLIVFASAATSHEMYENGVVSDGNVRFGDARDGIVSDVSEGGEIITGEGNGILGDMMDGTGTSHTNDMTVVPDKTDFPSTTGTPATTSNATTDGTGGASDAGNDRGMATGVIIAVIVVIAVVIIIFLLMPKRKG